MLTDEESEQMVSEYIMETLWAFNSEFILENSNIKNYDEMVVNALGEMQSRLCESANPLVFAMIKDIDDFIYKAIETDGRGHFLSFYDGEEHEHKGFYIYRIN